MVTVELRSIMTVSNRNTETKSECLNFVFLCSVCCLFSFMLFIYAAAEQSMNGFLGVVYCTFSFSPY